MSAGACRHRYAVIFDSRSWLCSVGILPMICLDCNARFLRLEKRVFLDKATPVIAAFLWVTLSVMFIWHRD